MKEPAAFSSSGLLIIIQAILFFFGKWCTWSPCVHAALYCKR